MYPLPSLRNEQKWVTDSNRVAELTNADAPRHISQAVAAVLVRAGLGDAAERVLERRAGVCSLASPGGSRIVKSGA